MEVEILEKAPAEEVGLDKLRQIVEQALRAAGETEAEVAVSLVDDDTIRHLSAKYLGRNTATDVLSFPQRDNRHEYGGHLGDIVISMDAARRQAATLGHSVEVEVCYLAEHGLLHLLGYAHDSPGRAEWNEAALRLRLPHHVLDERGTE